AGVGKLGAFFSGLLQHGGLADAVNDRFHRAPPNQTNSFGGKSAFSPIFFHRCRQYGWRLTYSSFGGWNCTTHSSSLQKISFTRHISSHVGQRLRKLTLTCSHPPAHDTMIAISRGLCRMSLR